MPKVLLFISFLAVGCASYAYATFKAVVTVSEPLIVVLGEQGEGPLNSPQAMQDESVLPTIDACLFVGSVNGSKYYPVGCKSASRIKEENIICFANELDAEEKGYDRTTACN